ncbi:MAG TPA: phosphoglycerate kinase [Woeseiaceae bacterium]|nr:phosphoglycerate kinase [Woeseiaceae bacterium]
MLKMHDVDLSGKKVLIREDLNVPITDGKIKSDRRIQAIIPTLKFAIESNCSVILMSHMGRPKEGDLNKDLSLKPVAKYLAALLDKEVRFVVDWVDGIDIISGEIVLLENVRFQKGEKSNNEILSKKMADLCDVFVMDAFACAHRAHASTDGVARYAKLACAGPLLLKELNSLKLSFDKPKRPIVAIVGGSKISTKLGVIKSLAKFVDYLILGGGIANTFIKALEHDVGHSLYEEDMLDTAKKLITNSSKLCQIPEVIDVVVGKSFSNDSNAETKTIREILSDDIILDVGPMTIKRYTEIIQDAETIIWNGPVGVFEFDKFGQGTKEIANAIARNDAFSAAGGGDTLAAIEKYNIAKNISYISTGGGAFLEFIESKTLSSVKLLEELNH